MGNLANIELLASAHSKARGLLTERVDQLQDDTARLQRRRLPGIKNALDEVRRSHDELRLAIDDARDDFKRPRTRVFHGIKLGLQKAKGSLKWANQARVIELIKKHLPDQVEILIKTTEKPVKSAVEKLSGKELKMLGVRIVGAGDKILIKPSDSELDKFIEALLTDIPDEETTK